MLIDWVPAHFPEDPHGLALFDGTHLYEHADPRQGRHPDWGTLVFNYGRNEVRNYLISNALFWLSEYHVDGLRVDAVASMLYLDYSREPGEWVPNVHGGNENLEAVASSSARTSSSSGGTPAPPPSRRSQQPGRWSAAPSRWVAWVSATSGTWAGCMTACSTSRRTHHRKYHHDEITFSLIYAFSENFVLPLSHDEVVHGKGSLINKMPGDEWQSSPTSAPTTASCTPIRQAAPVHGRRVRAEQGVEPRYVSRLAPARGSYAQGRPDLIKDLNALYKATPALYEVDFEPAGFGWIEGGDRENSVVSFLRRGREAGDLAVFVCNFTPVVRRLPYRGARGRPLRRGAQHRRPPLRRQRCK